MTIARSATIHSRRQYVKLHYTAVVQRDTQTDAYSKYAPFNLLIHSECFFPHSETFLFCFFARHAMHLLNRLCECNDSHHWWFFRYFFSSLNLCQQTIYSVFIGTKTSHKKLKSNTFGAWKTHMQAIHTFDGTNTQKTRIGMSIKQRAVCYKCLFTVRRSHSCLIFELTTNSAVTIRKSTYVPSVHDVSGV